MGDERDFADYRQPPQRGPFSDTPAREGDGQSEGWRERLDRYADALRTAPQHPESALAAIYYDDDKHGYLADALSADLRAALAAAQGEGGLAEGWRHAASVTHGSDTGLPARFDADHPAIPGDVLASGATACATCGGPVTGTACCTANVVNDEWHTRSCSGRMAGSGPRLVPYESRIVGHDFRAGEVEGWCVLCGRRRELHEPAAAPLAPVADTDDEDPQDPESTAKFEARMAQMRSRDPKAIRAAPPAVQGGGGPYGLQRTAEQMIETFTDYDESEESRGGVRSRWVSRECVEEWAATVASAKRAAAGPGGELDREAAERYRAVRDIGPVHRGDCTGRTPLGALCDCGGFEDYIERLTAAADAALAPLLTGEA